ncbi:hypothetical protein [Pararhizobium sp. LjRoot238]|uniref:hypothetical protein n=1 Tax=Pararhizobium sp. LjRoot238 TaxID=3342293 RepID=UPI003ECEC88F
MKKQLSGSADFGTPASLARFRKNADEFTKKHTSSREAALAVLKRAGITTASGKLSKRFSSK